MARVYVARHGETDWNRDGRYQGRLESSLTHKGERQAEALALALSSAGVRRVISSPLLRCVRTAQALARRLGVPVDTDERLVEISHGTWEGRLREDVERNDPATLAQWRSSPHTVRFERGESLDDVAARWRTFAQAFDTASDTAIITHDVLVRLAVLAAGDRALADFWKPSVENGGYAVFEVAGQRWTLIEECRRDHLEGIAADSSRQAL